MRVNEKYAPIHNWLDFRMNSGKGGASHGGLQLAIREEGETVFEQAYGYADEANDIALATSDKIACGSLTKALTVIEVLRAVEAGQLSLDMRLAEILQLNTSADKRLAQVTLEHLISHTSGLPLEFTVPGVFHGPSPSDGPIDDETFIDTVTRVPLMHEPGKSLTYSSTGVTSAGMMLERATGESVQELIRKNIFQPLGMENSDFGTDEPLAVKTYYHLGEVACGTLRLGAFSRSSGLRSTAGDIVKLDGVLLGERPDVLSEEALQYMTAPPHESSVSERGEGRGIFREAEGLAIYGLRSYCSARVTMSKSRPTIALVSNYSDQSRLGEQLGSVNKLRALADEIETDSRVMGNVYEEKERSFAQLIPLKDGGVAVIDPSRDDVAPIVYRPVPGKPYLISRAKGRSPLVLHVDKAGNVARHTGPLRRVD